MVEMNRLRFVCLAGMILNSAMALFLLAGCYGPPPPPRPYPARPYAAAYKRADVREDYWDRRENQLDRIEDRVDRRVYTGPGDIVEDRWDRRENRWDRREDRLDYLYY